MTLQDYIKLAEIIDKGERIAITPHGNIVHVTIPEYPLSGKFLGRIEIISAMAKALIEAEEALTELRDAAIDRDLSKPDSRHDPVWMKTYKALAQIQSLQENKNEQR